MIRYVVVGVGLTALTLLLVVPATALVLVLKAGEAVYVSGTIALKLLKAAWGPRA